MVAKHLRVIHLVDVVARQHDDVARHLARNRIEILVYGVGRAEVPMLADTLLRGEDFDEFAELFGHDVPAHPDVTVERKRLVLGADEDPPQAGIHAIAEREIDNPVRPAEVNRWFCALFGERKKTFPGAASEQNDENVVEDHDLGSPRAGVAILALRALTWLLRGAYDQPIRLIGFVLRGPWPRKEVEALHAHPSGARAVTGSGTVVLRGTGGRAACQHQSESGAEGAGSGHCCAGADGGCRDSRCTDGPGRRHCARRYSAEVGLRAFDQGTERRLRSFYRHIRSVVRADVGSRHLYPRD